MPMETCPRACVARLVTFRVVFYFVLPHIWCTQGAKLIGEDMFTHWVAKVTSPDSHCSALSFERTLSLSLTFFHAPFQKKFRSFLRGHPLSKTQSLQVAFPLLRPQKGGGVWGRKFPGEAWGRQEKKGKKDVQEKVASSQAKNCSLARNECTFPHGK